MTTIQRGLAVAQLLKIEQLLSILVQRADEFGMAPEGDTITSSIEKDIALFVVMTKPVGGISHGNVNDLHDSVVISSERIRSAWKDASDGLIPETKDEIEAALKWSARSASDWLFSRSDQLHLVAKATELLKEEGVL